MTWEVEARGVEAAQQRAMSASRAIPMILAEAVTIVALAGEGAVIAATPVGASGHLRQSITHQPFATPTGAGMRVFSTDVPIKVASVETGRSPGKMPPVAALELWVARKLGAENVHQVAFLVARAIGRRGTKGARMFAIGHVKAVAVAREQQAVVAARVKALF